MLFEENQTQNKNNNFSIRRKRINQTHVVFFVL